VLSSNISNPVYFVWTPGYGYAAIFGGGLYTIDNNIYGIDGDPITGSDGPMIDLDNVNFTGNILTGSSSGSFGGSVYIKTDNLDLSDKIIHLGVGPLSNGLVELYYNSLNTNSNTYIYEANALIINGSYYYDSSGNSETCTNGIAAGEPGCAWNGLFNPLIFYYNNAIGDGDWGNVSNWWHDAEFTIPAEFLPSGLNQVFIYGNITQNTGDPATAKTIVFNGSSANSIDVTVGGDAIFNGSSSNSGTITVGGNATFNGLSFNIGTTTAATSTFYEDTTSTVGGTIIGFLQRIFTASAISFRDFTTEGGRNDWTIISTGVNTIVDLSSAIYNLATNVFKGLLGGRFIENESIVTEPFSGVVWAARDSNKNWYSITSSADGSKLAAVVYGGQIYT
jgi:hypothetical protein